MCFRSSPTPPLDWFCFSWWLALPPVGLQSPRPNPERSAGAAPSDAEHHATAEAALQGRLHRYRGRSQGTNDADYYCDGTRAVFVLYSVLTIKREHDSCWSLIVIVSNQCVPYHECRACLIILVVWLIVCDIERHANQMFNNSWITLR